MFSSNEETLNDQKEENMFFVMFEHEGEIKLVAREVFASFEEADKRASLVDPRLKAFVCGKISKDFIKITPNTKSESNVLLHFDDSIDLPCVEVGVFSSDENGKITYKFEDGRTLNTNNLPKYFVPVPPEHDFVELKEGYTNAPTGEAVLLKFKSGYIVSGMFEKNEDDDGLGYLIWDGDMLDNNPTHYAPMPKLIK